MRIVIPKKVIKKSTFPVVFRSDARFDFGHICFASPVANLSYEINLCTRYSNLLLLEFEFDF